MSMLLSAFSSLVLSVIHQGGFSDIEDERLPPLAVGDRRFRLSLRTQT
jgi:hypothetical protein